MKFVNLTPHNLNILDKNGGVNVIPSSGFVARVSSKEEIIDVINNIEIKKLFMEKSLIYLNQQKIQFLLYQEW